MKTLLCSALTAGLVMLAPATPAHAGELKLSLDGGRVTLIATDVPLREILAEWARIGQTTVVNGEKLGGPPLTLHLENRPEQEVLDVLLREASGYIVAPRAMAVAQASAFDRIMILPTSQAPPRSAIATVPQFNNRPMPMPIQPDVDDDEPVEAPVAPPGNAPQAQPVPGMPPPGQPQAPQGLSRPGMPPPPPPGQPGPYPTGQPLPPGVRPPGGGGEGGA